jgi:hypothetical protein
LVPVPEPAPTKGVSEAKPPKPAGAEKTVLSQVQVPLAKEPEDEQPLASNGIESDGKLPPAPIEFPHLKDPEQKPALPSGTSVANTSQRMSFTPERNEIAGRTEQKLPPAAISAVASADSGGPSPDGGEKSSLSFSWHDTPPESLTINDVAALAGAPVPITQTILDAQVHAASPAGAAPLDRLEQMISHETLIIRQTGAQTLDVSLKLDSNTQLYLQLTNHNGSVQASVRCERGSFAPEDAQWTQLQQSLARQNVALLPMTGGSNLSFQQPSGQNQRQTFAQREDGAETAAPVLPVQPRQQKEQNRSRRNWESWA